jgi:hypothetical protein
MSRTGRLIAGSMVIENESQLLDQTLEDWYPQEADLLGYRRRAEKSVRGMNFLNQEVSCTLQVGTQQISS